MLSAIAATMPKRSVILPVATPPRPNPSMVSVKASDASPRVAPNSACTTGSTTTTDHMPTDPIDPIASASASRTHARRESGVKWCESLTSEGACTGRNFDAGVGAVKQHCRDNRHAGCSATKPQPVIPGQSGRDSGFTAARRPGMTMRVPSLTLS